MGGGETVALTTASALSEEHDVTILVTKKPDIKKLEAFFGLSLKNVKFKEFGKLITFLPSMKSFKDSLYIKNAYKYFDNYDLVIDTCSNGLFYKKIKPKTICYVHFPNYTKPKKGLKYLLNFILIKKEDMFQYDEIICNSKFTQDYLKKLTDKKTEVIYPPVKVDKIKPRKKENIIVTIGRYSPEKKHEVMIQAFKEIEKQIPEYEFHIIGSMSDKNYFESLKKLAGKSKIFFHVNMNHDDVLKFLEKSKIYWHARGYGETDPVEYENFGITTVEAMAAGCIPIVINLGAQPEIVKNKENIWNDLEELKKKTILFITTKKQNKTNIEKYSIKKFENEIKKIVQKK